MWLAPSSHPLCLHSLLTILFTLLMFEDILTTLLLGPYTET